MTSEPRDPSSGQDNPDQSGDKQRREGGMGGGSNRPQEGQPGQKQQENRPKQKGDERQDERR